MADRRQLILDSLVKALERALPAMTADLRSEMAGLSGTGGVGAVSVGVNTLVVILPPALFFLAWFIARRRNSRRAV
jgi:hypothetical protein